MLLLGKLHYFLSTRRVQWHAGSPQHLKDLKHIFVVMAKAVKTALDFSVMQDQKLLPSCLSLPALECKGASACPQRGGCAVFAF